MFDKLLGKSKSEGEPAKPNVTPPQNSGEAALLAAIEKQKQSDPLIGAKVAGKEILNRLMSGLKSEKGIHVESLFCALGSLAGYACQANLRAQAVARGMSPNAPFQVVTTKDGKQYYFGDPLNNTLAEGHLSVWSLAAGAAEQAGAKSLPDLKEIFQRTSATLGSESFGIPKYPAGTAAADLPIGYATKLWPVFLPLVKKLAGDPMLWPVAFSFAIQQAILMAKGAIAPENALLIVMEAAVPMSKVHLASP